MNKNATSIRNITAPKWAVVTDPEDGSVWCLACGESTDPQIADEKGAEHKDDCNAVALQAAADALSELFGLADSGLITKAKGIDPLARVLVDEAFVAAGDVLGRLEAQS